MYFGHKHVETRPNCSHGITTFLKYHMPLRESSTFEPEFRAYFSRWTAKKLLITLRYGFFY